MSYLPMLKNVRILRTERLTNSVNGNPRFDITFFDQFGEYTYRTSSDSSCNYEVSNFANSREPVDVWLTKASRVYRIDASKHASV